MNNSINQSLDDLNALYSRLTTMIDTAHWIIAQQQVASTDSVLNELAARLEILSKDAADLSHEYNQLRLSINEYFGKEVLKEFTPSFL